MKVEYKGFEVDAHKEKSMGGDTLLYYSVFRKSDGYEVTSGFSYGTDPIRTFVKYLKDIANDFLEDPQAYYHQSTLDDDPEPEEINTDAEPSEQIEDEL